MPATRADLSASLAKKLIATLEQAAAAAKEPSAKGALGRGRIYQIAHHVAAAADSYADALAQDPSSDEAEARLVIALIQLGQHERAIAHGVKLASRNPSYLLEESSSDFKASAYSILGDALASAGRIHEAKAAYEEGVKVKGDGHAPSRLAQLNLVIGDRAAAVKAATTPVNPRDGDLAKLLDLGRRNIALLPQLDAAAFSKFVAVSVHGRPFVVDGEARLAVIQGVEAWCDGDAIAPRA